MSCESVTVLHVSAATIVALSVNAVAPSVSSSFASNSSSVVVVAIWPFCFFIWTNSAKRTEPSQLRIRTFTHRRMDNEEQTSDQCSDLTQQFDSESPLFTPQSSSSLMQTTPSPSAMITTDPWTPYGTEQPSLSDAMIDTDVFLNDFNTNDEVDAASIFVCLANENVLASLQQQLPSVSQCKVESSDVVTSAPASAFQSAVTSPIAIPRVSSASGLDDGSYLSSNSSSVSEAGSWSAARCSLDAQGRFVASGAQSAFRPLSHGLDPIPEHEISRPSPVFTQIVQPVILPKNTPVSSYNISFPTTLQPRDRLDMYRGATAVTRALPTTSLQANSFSLHRGGATKLDPSEFQPLNVVEDAGEMGREMAAILSQHHQKASKRSRRSTPMEDDEDQSDGASSRQRRRSSGNAASSAVHFSASAESRRKDSIKYGLEELQRVLPHVGKADKEKISQASILQEGGRYIRQIQEQQAHVAEEIDAVKREIDELNGQIENFQSLLPADGAPLLPKIMCVRDVSDRFHEHVVRRTIEDDWRYWVFSCILGYAVNSFDRDVNASSFEELQGSAADWLANSFTLQKIRRDSYQKLAKLCAKTSIVERPELLAEEALRLVKRDFCVASSSNSHAPS